MTETGPREGLDFLTGEPVDGQILAAVLERGPLPFDDAVRFGIDIGMALARGQSRGQVHGRLSPHTVAVAAGGARVLQPPETCTDAFRAPEQMRGAAADARTDIWAFGALLYTMLAGEAPFRTGGATGWTPLEGEAKAVERLIAACLEQEPSRRRQRIQNVVSELRFLRLSARTPGRRVRAAASPADGSFEPQKSRSAPFGWRFWLTAALALVLVAAAAVAAALWLLPSRRDAVVQFDVPQPERTSHPAFTSVSPDGKLLAFVSLGLDGRHALWVRPLDAPQAYRIAGTEGAWAPFWSPDSRSIGFFAGRSLRRVEFDGSGQQTLCPTETQAGGGAWNADGTILFAPGLRGGFMKIPAGGGTPAAALERDTAHALLWPAFLPDGKHFLFFAPAQDRSASGVYAGQLGSAERKLLFPAETNAVYSPPQDGQKTGYLLYVEGRSLLSRPFDPEGLITSTSAVTVAEDVPAVSSLFLAPAAVSGNATLVYQMLGKPERQLQWLDRQGWEAAPAATGDWGPPRIRPDGQQAVAALLPEGGADAQLWVVEGNGAAKPIPGEAHSGSPVWSPDGVRLAFFRKGQDSVEYDLWVQSAAGGRAELLFRNLLAKYPTDWSRDGRFLLFNTASAGTRYDIWLYTFAEKKAGPLLETLASEGYAVFSPDGKWVAYQTDEAGRAEVFAAAFSGPAGGLGKRLRVTGDGGLPHWSADGQELFFLTADGDLASVSVLEGAEPAFGPPQRLFHTHPVPGTWNLYDVSPDGQRFLVNTPLEWSASSTIRVTTNWPLPRR